MGEINEEKPDNSTEEEKITIQNKFQKCQEWLNKQYLDAPANDKDPVFDQTEFVLH
jgi:hypothetical protein